MIAQLIESLLSEDNVEPKRLEEARDRTDDPAFRAELNQLISTIRSMVLERPLN